MTLQSTIKSGTVPLKLLGSESNNLGYNAAYPSGAPFPGGWAPLIQTTELASLTTQKEVALWLPLPLSSKTEVPRRSLSISWRYNSYSANSGSVTMVPGFQVRVLNIPWRPPGWDGQFLTTGDAQSTKLSEEIFGWDHDSVARVTTITSIQGVSTMGANGEDMQCYLRVRLPCKKSGSVLSIKLQILGLAVDQW